MKSILQHFESMDRFEWDYYSGIGHKILENPFFGNIGHKRFINQYFSRGGKSELIGNDGLPISAACRPSHTNSIFFLGLLLYHRTDLQKMVITDRNPPGYKTFPFIWFLTSLFHDFGAGYEAEAAKSLRVMPLARLRKEMHIDHFLLDQNIDDICKPLFNLCPAYFRYRTDHMKTIDHGVLGGLVLYDRLVKIRTQKTNDNNNQLFWDKSLEKQYAQAGAAIATHNIWMPGKKQHKIYRSFGLGYLNRFTPLTIKRFPLLYILGIVDTIDPIKAFLDTGNGINETYILSNIELSFKPMALYFRKKKDANLDFAKFVKKANSLKGWLDVDVVATKNTLRLFLK